MRLPYGEPAWLATRYADARFVLSDPRFSRAAAEGRDVPRQSNAPNTPGLLGLDPPDHTRLRKRIAQAFTTRQVERLRPWVKNAVADLLAGLERQGPPVDLVEDFALPLSIGVICELLGVPPQDRTRFRTWGDARLSTSELTAEEIAESTAQLHEYVTVLLARRRECPLTT